MSENKNKTGKSLTAAIVFSIIALTSAALGILYYLEVRDYLDHIACAGLVFMATGIVAIVSSMGAIVAWQKYTQQKKVDNDGGDKEDIEARDWEYLPPQIRKKEKEE